MPRPKNATDWTTEMDQRLVGLYREGMPLSALARVMDLAEGTIRRRAAYLGLPSRGSPLGKRPKTRPQTAKPLKPGAKTLPKLGSLD
jgi:hypothetical protein